MAQDGSHHHTRVMGGSGNPFWIPFLLTSILAVIELSGGVWTQSLALLSDAWHMLIDVIALGLATLAAAIVNRAKGKGRISHAELFVSSVNAILMLAVIGWIVAEAIERFYHPRPVAGFYVMGIAVVGLVVNLIVARQLHQHQDEKGLNHQAALLHVVGDILGSIAALVAGVVIYLTGWLTIDAALSLLISVLLLIGTLNLIRNIWRMLKGEKVLHHGHHH